MSEPRTAEEAIQELLDNRAAIQALFESKGWEIWLKWSESALNAYKDNSIAANTVAEREDNRAKYGALKYFNQLPFYFKAQIDKASADSASEIPPTTE